MLGLMIFIILTLIILLGFSLYIFSSQGKAKLPEKKSGRHAFADAEFAEELTFNFSEPVYHLPQTYDETYAILLVKDPHWLYVYWEIGEDAKEAFKRQLKDAAAWNKTSPVLRVYNTTHAKIHQAPYFDIPIHEDATNWYIKVGKPNNSFVVEVGRIDERGFYPLVRSNEVRTPAADVSEIIDPLWPPNEAVWSMLERAMSSRLGGSPQWGKQ